MKHGSNRRLANLRTRAETGFDYVTGRLEIQTPYGMTALKASRPYFPGQEEELRTELDKTEHMMKFAGEDSAAVTLLTEVFMCMKDISATVTRSGSGTLSVVEIFEVKSALLEAFSIRRILTDSALCPDEEFIPLECEELLDLLDPRHDRINTFYIYDDYSEKLSELRQQKRRIDAEIKKIQKKRKEKIEKDFGIRLTPKFDLVIPKSSKELDIAHGIDELEVTGEDYMSVTFALTKNADIYELIKKSEDMNLELEKEEFEIRTMISERISERKDTLLENFRRIGRLDHVLAKAIFALKNRCVKPEISYSHVVEIEDGRQLQVEDILRSKGKEYCPVSIELKEGVTCITGANMGGKTISLKLSGLVPILAQYGYFVPCRKAVVGLSNFMQILIGDSQSVERGLSSFGSEMEELKEILDHAEERSLILIDEIASGTNPVEGLALTKSLVEYMMKKPYITLITTHFETVTDEEGVRNIQVRGLADADFAKLDRELKYANRKERINIISRYMDYRLALVENGRQIPKDALNIAKMLGIDAEIINGAQKYIK